MPLFCFESLFSGPIGAEHDSDVAEDFQFIELYKREGIADECFERLGTQFRSCLVQVCTNRKPMLQVLRLSPFDAATTMLKDSGRVPFADRYEAFFTDYSLVPMLIQENYIDSLKAGMSGKPQVGRRLLSVWFVFLTVSLLSTDRCIEELIFSCRCHG